MLPFLEVHVASSLGPSISKLFLAFLTVETCDVRPLFRRGSSRHWCLPAVWRLLWRSFYIWWLSGFRISHNLSAMMLETIHSDHPKGVHLDKTTPNLSGKVCQLFVDFERNVLTCCIEICQKTYNKLYPSKQQYVSLITISSCASFHLRVTMFKDRIPTQKALLAGNRCAKATSTSAPPHIPASFYGRIAALHCAISGVQEACDSTSLRPLLKVAAF